MLVSSELHSEASLSVHIVILAIFIVLYWWRWLLLLQQLLAIKRAGGVKLQPRPYAVQVKVVILMAGELNYERILVFSQYELANVLMHLSSAGYQLTFKERIDANGAGVGRLQALLRHALQLVQKSVRYAFELGWRIIGVLA